MRQWFPRVLDTHAEARAGPQRWSLGRCDPLLEAEARGSPERMLLEELHVVAIRTGIVRETRRNHKKRMHRDPIEQGAEIDLGELLAEARCRSSILLEELRRDDKIEPVMESGFEDPGRRSGREDPRDEDVRVKDDPHRPRRIASRYSRRTAWNFRRVPSWPSSAVACACGLAVTTGKRSNRNDCKMPGVGFEPARSFDRGMLRQDA